jgi:hypothetical protein
MSGPLDVEEKCRLLLVSAMDGHASGAEFEQLNTLLRESSELRQSAARFLCDGSYLADAIQAIGETAEFAEGLSATDAAQGLGHLAANGPAPIAASGEQSEQRANEPSSKYLFSRKPAVSALRFVNRHGLLVASTAAVLLLAFTWHYSTMMSEFKQLQSTAMRTDPANEGKLAKRSRAEQSAGGIGSSAAARVTGLVNCSWPDGESPLKFGDELSPGHRLQLDEGLMQLTFATGAKVVVEGPTNFVVTAPGQATLERGRIAAAVPRFARGYTILTPTAEVVDLGTEFGVDVDDAGRSEVHVFEGDVVARPRGSSKSKAELIHARQDEAVEFVGADGLGQRITADRHKFVRRIIPDRSADNLPPLPVTKDLALWLAADMIPESKKGASVSTWPDVLVGDNRFPDDAWQFDERLCPKWTRDDLGRPAVRFNGWSSFLATSPMATSDQVTVFVAFAPMPVSFASEFHGGMLLRFGGDTPALEFSVMPDRSPKARVWSQHDNGTRGYVGELQGTTVDSQSVCATAYCYDADSNRAELFVNGNSAGVGPAPSPLEQNARKFIGAHAEPQWQAYFLGNIYEVIIYDSALDASDCNLVFQYLAGRYQRSLDD